MRHVNEESAEGLDSFMDIVTNVIGLMVLIAAAIVLNAQEIADFLAKANANWKQEDLRQMMKAHIDQTTDYAVDLLKNDYTNAITKFDEASGHMNMMSAALAAGIIKQFPDKFKTSKK